MPTKPESLNLGVPVVNFPRANAILARAQALLWVRDWVKTLIDLHRCSPAVNFRQQRNKNICECWTQNTVLIIHEENSKEMNVLINVCKSIS